MLIVIAAVLAAVIVVMHRGTRPVARALGVGRFGGRRRRVAGLRCADGGQRGVRGVWGQEATPSTSLAS